MVNAGTERDIHGTARRTGRHREAVNAGNVGQARKHIGETAAPEDATICAVEPGARCRAGWQQLPQATKRRNHKEIFLA
jgi:hypothetical protein